MLHHHATNITVLNESLFLLYYPRSSNKMCSLSPKHQQLLLKPFYFTLIPFKCDTHIFFFTYQVFQVRLWFHAISFSFLLKCFRLTSLKMCPSSLRHSAVRTINADFLCKCRFASEAKYFELLLIKVDEHVCPFGFALFGTVSTQVWTLIFQGISSSDKFHLCLV